MTANLGSFKWRGFFTSILICLLLGILIYRQFDFTQHSRPDDTAISQINELQKELIETRSKVEILENRLNQAEAKLATLSSRPLKSTGKPKCRR
jgi:uncharacterized protein YlxW (UPF0749 family)